MPGNELSLRLRSGAEGLRDLRVCLLAGTLGQGGAERQLYYIASALKNQGAKVRVLTLVAGEFWEGRLKDAGVDVEYVGASKSKLGRSISVFQAARRFQADIVQSQHFYTGIYSAIAARFLGVPSIGAIRSNGFNEMKSNGRLMGNLSLRSPNWMAANSQTAIENLRSVGYKRENFLLIPNVVDTERFKPLLESKSAKLFSILGVGSFEPVKRFDRLLQIAVALSKKNVGQIHVTIAGDGTLRQQIEGLAKQAREDGVSVELPGRVSDPVKLYQAADVLLLSSDWEGTPNVIMEAMACGLPVVATNVGGVGDLLKHGENGYLFDPSSSAEAVSALENLIRKPELSAKMSASARSFIEQNHSAMLLPKILAETYAKVVCANN